MSLPYLDKIQDDLSYTYKDRAISASFGYNYTQDIVDGLSSRIMQVTLKIGPLTPEERTEFLQSLHSLDVDTPFVLSLPGHSNTTVTYVPNSYKEVYVSKRQLGNNTIRTLIDISIDVREFR